jgi:Holliday junction resolvase
MAATPEKKVKAKVVAILKAHGAYYFSPTTFGMGRSGVPDIISCYKGCFIAIECKANGNKTTALQDREIEAIKAAGGIAMVIDEKSVGEVAVLLHAINKNYSRGKQALS